MSPVLFVFASVILFGKNRSNRNRLIIRRIKNIRGWCWKTKNWSVDLVSTDTVDEVGKKTFVYAIGFFIKIWPGIDLRLVGFWRFWYRWKADGLSFPTTPKSSKSDQYLCISWTCFEFCSFLVDINVFYAKINVFFTLKSSFCTFST